MRRNRTDYAINRYYSPETGRFTSLDPLTELDRPDRLNQPQGLNLYPYVMGGPTRYTDPDGRDWIYGPDNQARNVRSVGKGQRRISDKHSFTVVADEGNFKEGDELQYLSGGRVLIKVAGQSQKLPAGTIITYDYNQQPVSTQLPTEEPPPLGTQLASCHGDAEPFLSEEDEGGPAVGDPYGAESQISSITGQRVTVPTYDPSAYVDLGSMDVTPSGDPIPREFGSYEDIWQYAYEMHLADTGDDFGFVDDPNQSPASRWVFGPTRIPYDSISPETFEQRHNDALLSMATIGSGGKVSVIGKSWTRKGVLKSFKLPIQGKIRYVPPKNWHVSEPLPRGPRGGFIDRYGNEWTRGPSRTLGESFEWDVQFGRGATPGVRWMSRDGRHLNVSQKGRVTHK